MIARLKYNVLIILLLLGNLTFIKAQENNLAPWVMPTVIHRFNQKFSGMTQLAYSPNKNSTFIYLLGSYNLNKTLTLNGGYFRLKTSTNEVSHHAENDLVLSGIATVPISKIALEYRNMNMAIFSNDQDLQIYNRSRLRLIGNDFLKKIKPYAYLEEYYSLSDQNWFRNRKSVGFVSNITATTQLDLSYILQHQIQMKELHLVFLQFIITI